MDGIELRFLIERGEGEGPDRFEALPIPEVGGWLGLPVEAGGRPVLEEGEPRPGRAALRIEPLEFRRHPRLLAADVSGAALTVNGAPSPPLAVLGPRDEVRVGPATTLCLAVYREPRVEKPGADRAGGNCPVCRTPIEADRPVYFCGCGLLLHLDGEERPPDDRLECARAVEACPDCGRKVRWTAGYDDLPEGS